MSSIVVFFSVEVQIQKAKRELRPYLYMCSGAVALLCAHLRTKHCVHLAPSCLSVELFGALCVSAGLGDEQGVLRGFPAVLLGAVTAQGAASRGSCKAELTPVLGSSWAAAFKSIWGHAAAPVLQLHSN